MMSVVSLPNKRYMLLYLETLYLRQL